MRSATVASWINMSIQMAGMLIILPLIWERWNAFDLAVYLLVSSVNRFTMLFSERLAITFATLFSFASSGNSNLRPKESVPPSGEDQPASNQASTNESDDIPALFESIFATLGTILAGVSALTVGITSVLAFASLHRLGANYSGLTTGSVFAMGLSLVTLAIRINLLRYEVVLRGLDHIALLQRWNAAFNIVGLGSICITVLLGGTLVHWAIIYNLTIVLTGLRNAGLLYTINCQFDIRRARVWGWDPEVVTAAWSPTWKGLVSSLSYIGGEELIAMMSPFFLNGHDATQYLLYNRCLSIVGPIAQVPLTCRMPHMARLVAAGETAALYTFFSLRLFFCGLLALLGANLVGIAVPLLNFYSGKNYPVISPALWTFIVLLFVAERLNGLFNIVLECGNHILFAWRRVLVTALSLAIVPICITHFGIAGGFIALLAPRALLFHFVLMTSVASYTSIQVGRLIRYSYGPLFGLQVIAICACSYFKF